MAKKKKIEEKCREKAATSSSANAVIGFIAND
jgi:hypothetical protein